MKNKTLLPHKDSYAEGTYAVGVVKSQQTLEAALSSPELLGHGFEFRADEFRGPAMERGMREVFKRGFFTILTVRDPLEMGKDPWLCSPKRRLAIFMKYLSLATFIDIEARNLERYKELIKAAQKLGVGIIISAHYWNALPTEQALEDLRRCYSQYQADILKVAYTANSRADVVFMDRYFLRLFEMRWGRIALMPMGEEFAAIFRAVYAMYETALVYGHLGDPQAVPGQPSARALKLMLDVIQ